MQQDFAGRIGQEQVCPAAPRSRAFRFPLPQLPSLHPKRGILVSAVGFSVAVMLLSLLFTGSSVDASVPVTKEEWLKAQAIAPARSIVPSRVVLKPGDSAATALGELGFPPHADTPPKPLAQAPPQLALASKPPLNS